MTWMDTLVDFAAENLGEREREALWMRGVSDEQIESFQIGYLNVELPQFEDATAFLEWCAKGTRLDDVFVFPLTNTLGEVRGLQFRHVERERTGYKDFIPFEDELVMFGLGQAMPAVWETETVLPVEGVFDLFPIQRVYPFTVATLTANISRQFMRVLRRLVSEIWLGYDMDKTGRDACATFTKFYGREFRTKVVDFPRVPRLDGKGLIKDPSELWEAWGDERLGVWLRRLKDPRFKES